MKHLFSSGALKRAALMLLLCATASFVSCGGSSRDELSASKLKSLVSDDIEKYAQDLHYTSLKLGFYEQNNEDERYKLRQLAAAGVLTYKVERIEHKVSVRTGYDWWTGRTTYKQVTKKAHFVTATLTEAGRKCILRDLPEPMDDVDSDLVNNNDEDYPEFDVPEKEVFPEDQKTQPAAEPAAEPEAEQPAAEPAAEPKAKSEYEQAKDRENPSFFDLRTCKMRVSKVRNIRLSDGEARFEAILEYHDVTPFGRVIDHVYNGDKKLVRGSAIYYEDKGWTLGE